MESLSSILCFTGVLLFLMGLLTGFAIPFFRSSRIGLSAHLTGVQSGTFLIAFGLMWPKLVLWPAWSNFIGHAVWISLYAIFIALVLAAALGAGRDLPIAGGGIATSRARQIPVTVLMGGGSIAIMVVIAAVLFGWHWQAV